MKTFICDECDKETPTTVVERDEDCPVKGDPIRITTRTRICDVCGSHVYDRELDSATFDKAFEVYRSRHGILSPNDIVGIRNQYGLTQRSLSTLLGLGEITIHRYEKGSLPDEAHNQLLKLLRQPANMRGIVEERGHKLPPAAYKKVLSCLDGFALGIPEPPNTIRDEAHLDELLRESFDGGEMYEVTEETWKQRHDQIRVHAASLHH